MTETPTRAPDPRPARTRAAIKDAARRIALDSDADISVNAIAREAGISRSAFYDQYPTLDMLAIDLFREIFAEATAVDISRFEGAGTDAAKRREAAEKTGREFLAALDAHRAFFYSSQFWKTTSQVTSTTTKMFAEHYLNVFEVIGYENIPADTEAERSDLALFLAGGTLAFLTNWVQEGIEPPVTSVNEATRRLMKLHPTWLVGS